MSLLGALTNLLGFLIIILDQLIILCKELENFGFEIINLLFVVCFLQKVWGSFKHEDNKKNRH